MTGSGSNIINHEGTVTENTGRSVKVSIITTSACSGCHARGTCNISGSEVKIIEVKGSYDVNPGESVNVLMKQSQGYAAVMYGYLLPFLSVIIVLMILTALKIPELIAGLVSLSVLLPYYLIIYIFRKKINEKFTFTIKA
jgi:sigma-E factor negative regulatory protein RseC